MNRPIATAGLLLPSDFQSSPHRGWQYRVPGNFATRKFASILHELVAILARLDMAVGAPSVLLRATQQYTSLQ